MPPSTTPSARPTSTSSPPSSATPSQQSSATPSPQSSATASPRATGTPAPTSTPSPHATPTPTPAPTATSSSSFVALHTYFIAASGSDSNSGTSATACGANCGPWRTPNHSVKCGDVIIVAAGSYSADQFGVGNWGSVGSCPSTTAGIDGTGGIYFATVLCAGPTLTSCEVDGGSNEAFRVDASNWAVEGFSGTQLASANGACFSATSETTTTLHHIAFINDVAANCALAGFDSYSWHGSTGGVDQQAVVGTIAFNGAPSTNGSGLCGSGISLIPEGGPDTSAGTHIFVAGAFSYKNVNAPSGAGCNTDGEGLIFDSWGNVSYHYQAVAEQNAFWANGSAAFEAFPQGNHSSQDEAPIVFFHNTAYGDYQDPKNGGGGEIFFNQIYPTGTGSYTITNNIFEAALASAGNNGTTSVRGAEIDCINACAQVTIGGNYIWNSSPPTTTTTGGENTHTYINNVNAGASWPWGSNTYNDPGLANAHALPTNAPNCSAFANTTACMTGAGVVADLAPSGGAAAEGYQPPGPCSADAYYPTWLKGVVYLTWNGSALSENTGLVSKPCNL